jgi:HSP20 family protein
MARQNETQQASQQPQQSQQSPQAQSQSRPQKAASGSAQPVDPSGDKSPSAPKDASRPIPTSSEVPARRSPLFNAGRLVTPWELMRRMNAELDRLVAAVDMQRSAGSAEQRTSNTQTSMTDGRGADELARVDWVPRIEVLQREGEMVVRAELPGVDPDKIEVNVQNGILSIWGERQQERREDHDGTVRTERVYGTFFRSIPLPDGANEELAAATLRNGVLEVTIPMAEHERGRRIPVKS